MLVDRDATKSALWRIFYDLNVNVFITTSQCFVAVKHLLLLTGKEKLLQVNFAEKRSARATLK